MTRGLVFRGEVESEALGLHLSTAQAHWLPTVHLSWASQALPVSVHLAGLFLFPLAFIYCYKAAWTDGLGASWAGRVLPCSMMSAAAKDSTHGGAELWKTSL